MMDAEPDPADDDAPDPAATWAQRNRVMLRMSGAFIAAFLVAVGTRAAGWW